MEGNYLVCPYHEWAFDAQGKNQCIPYCKRGGPQGMVGVGVLLACVATCGNPSGTTLTVLHRHVLTLHRRYSAAIDAQQPGRRRICGWVRRSFWVVGWVA